MDQTNQKMIKNNNSKAKMKKKYKNECSPENGADKPKELYPTTPRTFCIL